MKQWFQAPTVDFGHWLAHVNWQIHPGNAPEGEDQLGFTWRTDLLQCYDSNRAGVVSLVSKEGTLFNRVRQAATRGTGC